MPIRILLTSILLTILCIALVRRKTFPPAALSLAAVCSTGIMLVWFPEFAMRLALMLGVGRGTDLIFYCFIVATLAVSMWLFFSLKSAELKITVLAREIAIMNTKTHPIDRRKKNNRRASKGKSSLAKR